MRTIFADFCTDILSRIFLPVSWQIFYIYDTQISTENIYHILLKQTGYCSAAGITFFFSIFIWVVIHTSLLTHLLVTDSLLMQQLIKLDRIPSNQPIGKPVILLQTNDKVLKNLQWIFIECLQHDTYFNLLFLRRMLKTPSILIEIIISLTSLTIYVV
jgi:hypothetical protein